MAGISDLLAAMASVNPSGAPSNDVTVVGRRLPPPPAGPVPMPLASPSPSDPNIDMGTLQSPQAPSLNYDNSRAVAAVQAANDASPARGGSSNPGLYGLLPAGLQHGTFRNVLGALGDAFLVQAGHDPEYANNMARQSAGNAVAGLNMDDPQSVQAASQRLAATGSPGAMDQSDKIQTQAENAQLRKAQMDYTNLQRQQMNQIRYSGQYQNIGQKASGQIATATAATYPQLYAQLDRRVKQLDPSMDAASALDIPQPQDFQEGALAHYGMSGNNVQQASDRGEQRQVSLENNASNNTNHITVAGINSTGKTNAATISANRPSEAQFKSQYSAMKAAGQPTTPEDDARFTYDTTHATRGGARAPLIGVPGATAGRGGTVAPPHIAPSNVPTSIDVSYLKSHPEVRAQFEAHFGKGAAAKYLGH